MTQDMPDQPATDKSSRRPAPISLFLKRIPLRPGASIPVVEKPACPHCNDRQHFSYGAPVGDPLFGETFPCPYCNAVGDLRNLQDLSGLTQRERQWRLGDIDTLGRPGTASMVSACQQILAQPSGLLTLWGPCGNGKSMALQAIVNEVIERRIRALYQTMTDLLGHLREAMDPTPEGRLGSLTQRRKRLAEICLLYTSPSPRD